MVIEDYENVVRVQVPLAKKSYIAEIREIYPDAGFPYREGSYMKGNTRLNDGTVVFEWMGWYER
jgi:hypothetical protein